MNKKYILTVKESNCIDVLKVIMCIAVLYIRSYSSTFTGVENTFGKVVVGITYFMSRIICDCGVPVFIFYICNFILFKKIS